MCPSCSLHAGNAKHVDHLELPKRKLRLAVVRSKTQVAFGRLPCCMNTTCLKRVVMESINQTESKTQKAKARVAGVLIYKVLLNFCELRGHSALLRALVERWRPETHTFHLPVSEVIVTLEDVSYILGLPVDREPVNGRSDSSHQFLVENCITCFGREPGPQDHVLGKVSIPWVRRCRDTEPCDTQESIERYVRAHIFCVLGTVVFPDKSTTSLNSKFLPLLRDFHWILAYSWGQPRMLFLAPIPRDQLVYVGIPLARRWSHWRRHTRYTRWPTEHFRRALDNRGFDDFIWRTYMGVGVPDVLAPYLAICSTHSPLVSFECIEWHPTERVRRQFGMQQLPSGPAFDLGRDHCKRLTGAQNHDWGEIYSEWVNRWRFDCYNTLQLGEEIIDFHPLPVVASEEVGADELQQQQEEPANPQEQVPPHEQQEHVTAHEHHYQVPAYEHQVQIPAYAQQFQDPTYTHQFQHLAYAQQFQGPAYAQQFQDPTYAQQWPAYQQQAAYILEPQPPQAPEPYIPQLVIPAEGHFSPLGGSDTISFSQVLRDTYFLSPPPPQEGPATSQHSGGRRATSGHASDFDFDDPTGDVDPPGPSAPPRGQLFDLNEYPEREEEDLGYDLQHWYDLGGASAPGMSGSGLYDTGGASMTDFGGPDVGSGLGAGVSQGHPYNSRTQTAPPNKYTPSLYAKKALRK
ncbi:uncharacterized protein DS421_9g261390 [Arachis hypogaea]|nr:uncharacterized protein DS421_9g261390 [Arachis hypogaea]